MKNFEEIQTNRIIEILKEILNFEELKLLACRLRILDKLVNCFFYYSYYI